MKCALHPDRTALGYCSRCGRPLCKSCLVRLSSGNFCQACTEYPEGRQARAGWRIPWWAIALIVLAALVMFRAFVH